MKILSHNYNEFKRRLILFVEVQFAFIENMFKMVQIRSSKRHKKMKVSKAISNNFASIIDFVSKPSYEKFNGKY